MIHEAIYDCAFCGKQNALPIDLWGMTKLEFVDNRSNVKVIRVKFAGRGDEQVLVKRRYSVERRQRDSTLR